MTSVRWRLLAAAGAAFITVVPTRQGLHAQAVVTGRVAVTGTGQPLADARVVVIGPHERPPLPKL